MRDLFVIIKFTTDICAFNGKNIPMISLDGLSAETYRTGEIFLIATFVML